MAPQKNGQGPPKSAPGPKDGRAKGITVKTNLVQVQKQAVGKGTANELF